MTNHDPLRSLGLSGYDLSGIADAGESLDCTVRMLEAFREVGDTTNTWFQMVACPSERGIARFNVHRDPAYAGEDERFPLVVYGPSLEGGGMTGLTLK
jgi:hypothetical protein